MIAIIVAMTKNRIIGKDNSLPWHLPEDLKNFRKLTKNNVVIMGRKTWDSIPEKYRPLPNRTNIIISRTIKQLDNAIVKNSIEDAIQEGKKHSQNIFIIGGASIYQQALPLTDTLIISWVKEDYPGDTKFPEFNLDNWQQEEEEQFTNFTFNEYRRK